MANYRYRAADIEGKIYSGEAETESEEQLKNYLMQRKKLYLISCESFTKRLITKPLPDLEISDMCRQIGSMLQAGITVVKAMEILLSRDVSANMKIVMHYMNKRIKLGNAFSEVMRESGAFPPLLVSMVEAGEAGGNTENIMLRMAEYYENQHKTKKNISSALAYPLFLAVLLVAAMIAIFVFIIPKFIAVFDNVELPIITVIVIAISNFLIDNWLALIIGAVILAFVMKMIFSIPAVKVFTSKRMLHAGKVGRLFGIIYTARFCRSFSELYASGLPIIKCMQISRFTVGCSYIERQFDNVIRDIRQGVSIAEALSHVDGFDTKLKSSVLIGEESGRLEFMLTTMAESFEFESDQAIKKLTGMIEPIMIVTMGVLVALVFAAVMMPVFSIYESIG